MIITQYIHVLFFLFLVYKLRTDLSLGNGFAVSAVFVLIMLICNVFISANILFLLLSLLPFIPIVSRLFFRIPILSKILFELGVLLKVLIRFGIPRSKIEEVIHKTYGVKISEFDSFDKS